MAKPIAAVVKLQVPAGQATPAPPVGTALGPHGVNIMEFVKQFNAKTAHAQGMITPVEVTIFKDRTFTFITKTPPAASASFALSPCAITSTRIVLPVPWGRLTVPRTTWSACLGSTPRRTATSTDSSNLA